VGTMESSDDEDLVENTKVNVSETPTKPTIGEEWMIDDVGTIESSDDEELIDSNKVLEPPTKPTIGEEWMIDDVGTMESSDDDGETDKQEKMIDGRLSSLSVAQRFSCDDDEQFEELILESESTEQPSAEETSWAFIVSSKEKEKLEEDAPKVQHSGEIKEIPCPPLVIEIIEKEEPKLDIDDEGYRVVSNKNKSKKKSEESKTLPYDIIDKLDQPVGSRPYMEEIVQPQDEDEEMSFESNEGNEEQSTDLKNEIEAVKNIVEKVKQGEDVFEGSENTDPWLALKDEYIRSDSETQEAEGYTIDVKVSTKETCIGRKLHSPEATEWKMDIQCVQQDSCPDIIDKSVHMDRVPASHAPSSGSSQISLAPSWMRRGLTENENRKQADIFENLKGKVGALPKDNTKVDSKEERSEEEEIYYRIKNKVKKKRRRTTSNTSQTSSNSNSLPRPDPKESLVNKVKTPLIKLQSTTSSIAMEVGSTNSSFDRRDLDLDNDLSISDKSVSVEKDDDDVNQSSEIIINFDDSKCTDSNMLVATEKLRAVSPNQPHFVSYQRQTSRDMEDAVEVQRPIRKISSSENTLQPVLSIDSTIGPGEKDSMQKGEDIDNNAKTSEIKKKWSDIASKAVHLQKIESLEKQPSPVENRTETIVFCDEEPKDKEKATVDKDGFETIERKKGKRSRRNTESVHEDPPVQPDIVSAAFSYDLAMIEAAETKYQEQLAKRASLTDSEIKTEEVEKSKTTNENQPIARDKKHSESSKIEEATPSSPSKKKDTSPRLGQDLLKNISDEKFWLDRHIYEEAEYRYFEKKVKIKTPLLKSSNMSEDSDKDGSGSKDESSDQSKDKENKEDKEEADRSSPAEEFYNWTDESTYLSPSIPVLSPPPISLEKPLELINEEGSLSLTVSAIELQVMLDELRGEATSLEEQLNSMSDDQLEGQVGVLKFTLGKLEDLNKDATAIEQKIQSADKETSTVLSQGDKQQLSAQMTGIRTQLVRLETQLSGRKGRVDTYLTHRKKRVQQVKKYQALLIDLEVWLTEVQVSLNNDLQLTSLKVVRDQIRGCQVLEEDLRLRVSQLGSLSRDVGTLSGSPDVSGLAEEMRARLSHLSDTMAVTQTGLADRLAHLKV